MFARKDSPATLKLATSHGEGWKRVLGWLEAFVERIVHDAHAKVVGSGDAVQAKPRLVQICRVKKTTGVVKSAQYREK